LKKRRWATPSPTGAASPAPATGCGFYGEYIAAAARGNPAAVVLNQGEIVR